MQLKKFKRDCRKHHNFRVKEQIIRKKKKQKERKEGGKNERKIDCGDFVPKSCPTFTSPWTVAHQVPLSK